MAENFKEKLDERVEKGIAGFLENMLVKEVQKESEITCQLWSDATELNHLDFTPPPPLPKYEKPLVEKNKVGWRIFFMAICQLKP